MSDIVQWFTPDQIAEACGGHLICRDPAAPARGVCTDTRRLEAGQAFFALKGERHDGHDFVPQAVAEGARVLVLERLDQDWLAANGTAVVLVRDTARALLDLAAWHRTRLRARIVAVTGSYGKSTVKDMIGAVLSWDWDCTTAPASYNNRIGVALTLLSATHEDDFVVLEMGTNHPGEIDELARAAAPDVGVITAVGEVHLEGLGSLEGVREAKAELIPHISASGALVLNGDDELCRSLASRFGGPTFTYGLWPNASVRPERIHGDADGWQFDARGWVFRLGGGPRHNVLNAAAAVCTATALGVPLRSAALALAGFRPPPMRYQRLELGGVTFICDCYNSSPPTMRAALRSFLHESNEGRKVVVCGDMLELGEHAPRLHREIGAELAAAEVDTLVAVGQTARHVVEGWHTRALPSQSALYFESAEDAWSPLWWELRPGDAVLLKGSRRMRLETITERIAEHLGGEGKEEAA
jgi:UDP-N-acetylmuramoyl-tripeptide--D-alanyl-D-alanine ligase